MISVYRKILSLLDPRERRRFFLLMGMVIVMSIFETITVASILPFLQVVSSPETVTSTPLLNTLYQWVGSDTVREFTIVIGIATLTIQVVGLFVRGITLYLLNRFSIMRAYSISSRLLASYLNQPYAWFLNRNTSDLSKNVLSEVDIAVRNCILPALRMTASLVVALFIGVLVFVVEPEVALGITVILIGVYAVLFLALRNPLVRIGGKRVSTNEARFRAVQDATGGIKELKVIGLEKRFLKRFRDAAYWMAHYQSLGMIIPQIPRIVLEGLAFASVVGIVLMFMLRGDGSVETILPTLGLVGAAGIRLLPALQQVYFQASTIRFNAPALDRLCEEVEALDKTAPQIPVGSEHSAPRLRRSLSFEDVSYSYPSADRTAVDQLSLSVAANTTVAFVGGTGAGKTTAVDLILGLLSPDSGRLVIDDEPLTEGAIRDWQSQLGYVPQQIFLLDQTIAENIAFGVSPQNVDRDAVERAARMANLHDFVVSELPEGYDTPVGERGVRLSGGQRQRIGIARALYHDPDILVFDEATSALDNLTERAVMEAVQRLGGTKTVILIAHRLSTVRHCDRIFLMQHGKLVGQGTYEELTDSSSLFREMSQAS